MRPHLTPLVAWVFTIAVATSAFAPAARAAVHIDTIHTGVAFPTAIRFAPDGRLFVLERTGRVLAYASGTASSYSVWATLPTSTTYDRGLLGIAFHPSFPDSPYVYLFHSNPSPLFDRVVRLTDSLGVGTHYCVIKDGLPTTGHQHNGGRLCFLADGTLLVSYGDNNVPAAARDPNDVRGKLLRITTLGAVPAGQPFSATNPAYVYGIRNVFGTAVDPITHTIYFTMNGPTCDDTIHRLVAGGDYGWGPADTVCGVPRPGAVAALWRFSDVIAPTGCVVYRGFLYPGWDGNLLFGSYLDDALRRAVFHPGSSTAIDSLEVVAQFAEGVLDVTEDATGQVWVCTTSAIHRLTWDSPAAVTDGARDEAFVVRPNPSHGAIAFAWRPGERARFELLDLAGRRVCAANASGGYTWDGRDANGHATPAGLYFARLTNVRGVRVMRVVRLTR